MRLSTLIFAILCIWAPGALAVLNADCQSDTDCEDVVNSVCVPDLLTPEQKLTCQCAQKYVPDSIGSLCIAAIGEECKSSEAKASCNAIPYALCTELTPGAGDLTCQCTGGYVSSADNLVCLLNDFRDRCVEDSQCVNFHNDAKCSTQERCQCPNTHVQGETKCLDKKNLGIPPCEEDVQCPENASCTGIIKSCNCLENYVQKGIPLLGSSCVPMAFKVGGACEINDQCARLNLATAATFAECVGNKCLCPDDHVASIDGISCLPTVGAGEPCKQDVQCPAGEICNYPNCSPTP